MMVLDPSKKLRQIEPMFQSKTRYYALSSVLGALALFTLSTPSAAEEGSGDLSGATEANAFCSAVTTCFSPFRPPYSIGCQTYGQGCTWWVVPNHSVQCTGFDAWGRWVNFYFRCW